MPEDYTSNSKKAKEAKVPNTAKNIEKVVVGEVLVQKKPIGRKFRDMLIAADFKSVFGHVVHNIFIPAAKNMLVDSAAKGAELMVYGEASRTRRGPIHGPGPRVTYNSPINRGYGYRDPRDHRTAPPVEIGPRRSSRLDRTDYILSSREEAETVLERMSDIIDQYEVATVGDLNELVGFPTTHIDNKWGWIYLGDVQIRQIREGFMIDFPPAEPLP